MNVEFWSRFIGNLTEGLVHYQSDLSEGITGLAHGENIGPEASYYFIFEAVFGLDWHDLPCLVGMGTLDE